MSNDKRTTEIQTHSAKLLNSEALYQDFLKRTEGEMILLKDQISLKLFETN